jgi:hypothetical protein
LTTPSSKIKTVYVSTATYHFPVLYAKCRVEEIAVIEDVRPDGARIQSSEVSAEICVNPIDEMVTISIDIVAVAAVLLICIAALDKCGYVDWKSVLCCVATRRPFRDFSGKSPGIVGVDLSDVVDIQEDPVV